MFAQRVLGVDPGLSRCGVAVLDGPAVRAMCVAADVIRTAADTVHAHRLAAIHDGLDAMIDAHAPAALAVERVFINHQARTGIGAVQVVGLVHLLGARHGLPVAELTPSQVKAAVTGVGDADKDQVTYMVQRMLNLPDPPRPADKADAMAVALCRLQQAAMPGAAAGSVAAASGGLAADDPTGAVRRPADGPDPDGLPPRLAAALAEAGPGLAAIPPPQRRTR